jgi:hypothetical protein
MCCHLLPTRVAVTPLQFVTDFQETVLKHASPRILHPRIEPIITECFLDAKKRLKKHIEKSTFALLTLTEI